jgi:hypothetical protein
VALRARTGRQRVHSRWLRPATARIEGRCAAQAGDGADQRSARGSSRHVRRPVDEGRGRARGAEAVHVALDGGARPGLGNDSEGHGGRVRAGVQQGEMKEACPREIMASGGQLNLWLDLGLGGL